MNEEYIKEYEEMSLCDFADELVEPLFTIKQDLTKTIYIHYANKRDKNEQLQQENTQLKAKIKYYETILEKLANNQELSTGQFATYSEFKKRGSYDK